MGLEASKTISEAGSFETKNAGGGNWSSLENGTDIAWVPSLPQSKITAALTEVMKQRAHRLSSATSTGSSAILSVSLLPGSVSDTLADPLESATSSER